MGDSQLLVAENFFNLALYGICHVPIAITLTVLPVPREGSRLVYREHPRTPLEQVHPQAAARREAQPVRASVHDACSEHHRLVPSIQVDPNMAAILGIPVAASKRKLPRRLPRRHRPSGGGGCARKITRAG